jgi:hypothetical protein
MNEKPVLSNDDALRAIQCPELLPIHNELIKLGLVLFDSGYASVMAGFQLTAEGLKV